MPPVIFVERDLLVCSVGGGLMIFPQHGSRRRNTRLLLDGGGAVVRADGEDRDRPVLGDEMSRLRRRKEEGFWLRREVVMAMNCHSWP